MRPLFIYSQSDRWILSLTSHSQWIPWKTVYVLPATDLPIPINCVRIQVISDSNTPHNGGSGGFSRRVSIITSFDQYKHGENFIAFRSEVPNAVPMLCTTTSVGANSSILQVYMPSLSQSADSFYQDMMQSNNVMNATEQVLFYVFLKDYPDRFELTGTARCVPSTIAGALTFEECCKKSARPAVNYNRYDVVADTMDRDMIAFNEWSCIIVVFAILVANIRNPAVQYMVRCIYGWAIGCMWADMYYGGNIKFSWFIYVVALVLIRHIAAAMSVAMSNSAAMTIWFIGMLAVGLPIWYT